MSATLLCCVDRARDIVVCVWVCARICVREGVGEAVVGAVNTCAMVCAFARGHGLGGAVIARDMCVGVVCVMG